MINLRTYSKISYQDKEGVQIEVKWYNNASDQLMVEIKQPQYTLTFNPTIVTQTNYVTPQGNWQLRIHTQKIETVELSDGIQIEVDYRIIMNDNPLGDYQFRLHYV